MAGGPALILLLAAMVPPAVTFVPSVADATPVIAIVTPTDYPERLGRQGVGGTTATRLLVDPRGRVSECRVTATSGNLRLDRNACTALHYHFQFAPLPAASTGRGQRSIAVAWIWAPPNVITIGPFRLEQGR